MKQQEVNVMNSILFMNAAIKCVNPCTKTILKRWLKQ